MSHSMKMTLRSAALVVCLVAAAASARAQSKLLTVPDTTAKKGDMLLIPVRVSALATIDSVYSGQFTLSYNSGVMYIYDISTAGTILAGLGSVSFDPTTRQFAFASGTIITGSGTLVYLKVATSASPSSLSDSLRLTSAFLNEGNPGTSVDNGYFRFRTITVAPKTPPGNLVIGDSLQFSVSGDQIPPLTWSTSDPTVATIDANGKLHGVAVGQVKVFVQDSQGLTDSTSLFPVNSALLNSLTLSTHDTSYTQTLVFNLPIYISDVTGLGITSSQFSLTFSSAILQALDVITAGSMTSSWSSPAFNISGGRIDLAMAGSQPLSGAGVLVYVRFKVLSSASGSTTLTLSNVLFNESINAALANRTFTALAAPILTLTPSSAILTLGDTTTFRVTSGGHPPYAWTSNDPSVITVGSSTGLVTAVGRGTTTVTVVDVLGFSATSGSIRVNDVRVILPDTVVSIADSVDVPIRVDNLTGLNLYSYDFRLVYDSTVVRFAQLLAPATMSSAMTFAVRDTVDTLRVGAAGAAPLSGGGTLLKLRFKAAPGVSLGQLSSTKFAFFSFNETSPTTPTATTVNGKISIAASVANIKVFLQGPFSGGAMTTTLNTSGYIPRTSDSAYAAATYGYTASTVSSIPSASIVDWLLVELRSDTAAATKVARRAGFLKSDGTVVDTDGVSALRFAGLSPGNYYIVVRHRNHLAIMSAAAVALSATSALYDFTNAQAKAYGTNAMAGLAGGAFGMIAGDVNQDGIIKYNLGGNDRALMYIRIGSGSVNATVSGYYPEDVNLDGIVKYNLGNNDRAILYVNIGGGNVNATVSTKVPK